MQNKIKIYEIAQELNISDNEVIEKAKELNIVLKSSQSVVTFEESEKIKKYILDTSINLLKEKIDFSVIEKRLKLLSLALEYEDYDIVEILISKILEINDLDNKVVDIITNVEFNLRFRQFEHSLNEIRDYLNKKLQQSTTIIKYDDIELLELKQQLKKLEIKFQELIEQKTEYLNDIEEFNTQYNIHLGELIRTILNLKKEIFYKKTIKHQKLKKQFETNKDICDETKQTIDELKSTVVELEEILENIDEDDENYEEIKSAYDEIKEELENLENELIIQEEELERIKEKIEEDEVFEEEYEEAKSTYEEFDNEYEHIKDTQKDVQKLNDEDKKELKLLYKRAAKLCHPDIVSEEFKEKAHEIMQSLNDAYSKKDISQVKQILLSLENGTTFKTLSNDIDNKELLLSKIKEFEQNIIDLQAEIETIKEDDTYTTISELENWDEYFEELKTELQKEKDMLEDEAIRVLEEKEEIEEWILKLWNWADENNIPNGKLARQKENLLATTTIEFIGLKLTNIPKELFYLQNITTLVLWDNDISSLPDEIVNFTNLKKLNLRGNRNLTITSLQKKWLEELRKRCTVFVDEISNITDEEIVNFNNINKLEIISFIKNWIINEISNLYDINISNDLIALQRINDVSNSVYDDFLNKNISNINLPFIAVDLKNSPIHFSKENITFETLNSKSNNKLKEKDILENKYIDNIEIFQEDSKYSKYILSIENIKFEKIRKYCENLLNDNQADEMQEYLAQKGRMYKALIYDSLEQFIEKQLDGKNITLIDWGCKQGIASMLVLDYIKEKQLNINVHTIVLIDNEEKALSRAMVHAESLDFSKAQIIPIYTNDNNYLDRIKTIQNGNTLNLYANDKIVIDFLDIDFDLFENAYFMCVSNENKKFVDEVYENIENFINIESVSIRDSNIGNYEKFERIFKI